MRKAVEFKNHRNYLGGDDGESKEALRMAIMTTLSVSYQLQLMADSVKNIAESASSLESWQSDSLFAIRDFLEGLAVDVGAVHYALAEGVELPEVSKNEAPTN